MSEQSQRETNLAPAAEVQEVRVENEMEQSYIDYSMSVIAGRALPDARDGLKPVQRRILYAMHEEGVKSTGAHQKSSSVVGTTMGNFHPHGDSSIYDSLVRMAQDFSLRVPLVDGQGNFGSIDDDPPAAMRYTEARLAPSGELLLEDIDSSVVPFEANYDGRTQEPNVLPAAFPNLLVNGASGIAVGMSTEIPPHNPDEVIDAALHLVDNPDTDVETLMEHVPGPDFPTGGTIVGREPIREAYETGRGRIRVRADYEIVENENERDQIVVTEIPYQTKKSRLIEKIADRVNDDSDELNQITNIRDDSDQSGIRIVIELKRDAIPDVVVNQLLESFLERTFGVIMLALVDGQPQILSLKQALYEYIEHRRTVIRRRTEEEREQLRERRHILEGRLVALDNVEDIIELIQDSTDRSSAQDGLTEEYDLSQEQAEHITRMQIGSLTSMEREEIESEYEDVEERTERLTEILENQDELDGVVKKELQDTKSELSTERRTTIVEDRGTRSEAELTPEHESIYLLTEEGYVKRMQADDFSAQGRGGKGLIGIDLKRGDAVEQVLYGSSHDTLLFLTDKGNIYRTPGYNITEANRNTRGDYIGNTLRLDDEETVTTVLNVSDAFDNPSENYLATLTDAGTVKRTVLSEYENIQSTGIRAVKLKDDERLVDATITSGDEEYVTSTRDGQAIRFEPDEVRPSGRATSGVGAIQLDENDVAVALTTVTETEDLLTVTKKGYGKRTAVTEYRVQSRYGRGIRNIKPCERNGPVQTVRSVAPYDQFVMATSGGQVIRVDVSDVSSIGRNTKGVKLMTVEENDEVVSTTVFSSSQS